MCHYGILLVKRASERLYPFLFIQLYITTSSKCYVFPGRQGWVTPQIILHKFGDKEMSLFVYKKKILTLGKLLIAKPYFYFLF